MARTNQTQNVGVIQYNKGIGYVPGCHGYEEQVNPTLLTSTLEYKEVGEIICFDHIEPVFTFGLFA